MFVNTLALRFSPGGHKSFEQYLQETKEITLNAFANQDYPFEKLVEFAAPNWDSARNPLFDSMFTLQNIHIPDASLPGLNLTTFPLEHKVSRFDMTWIAIEVDEEIHFTIEFNTAIFKIETIENFARYYQAGVDAILENSSVLLKDMEMIPSLEDSSTSIYDEASGDFGF